MENHPDDRTIEEKWQEVADFLGRVRPCILTQKEWDALYLAVPKMLPGGYRLSWERSVAPAERGHPAYLCCRTPSDTAYRIYYLAGQISPCTCPYYTHKGGCKHGLFAEALVCLQDKSRDTGAIIPLEAIAGECPICYGPVSVSFQYVTQEQRHRRRLSCWRALASPDGHGCEWPGLMLEEDSHGRH